ncbi:MAG: HAD family phosphatase [Tannerellaceae bacterium]|nr:HAD family phosphatase [Tannerellaceae bacterium]
MATIKHIVFDLGGVIMTIDRDQAVKRFEEIGVKDAAQLIDPYEQKGIFLDLEDGSVDAEGFRRELSQHVGKEITPEEVSYGWLGFVVDVPQEKLDYILELRKNYKVYLLSNTNPVIQAWARSPRFSAAGRPINEYFDKMYASYELKMTKPDPEIFKYMLKDGNMDPGETLFIDDGKTNIEVAASLGIHTYQPINGADWREELDHII